MDAEEARERGMGGARGCIIAVFVLLAVALVVFGAAWLIAV